MRMHVISALGRLSLMSKNTIKYCSSGVENLSQQYSFIYLVKLPCFFIVYSLRNSQANRLISSPPSIGGQAGSKDKTLALISLICKVRVVTNPSRRRSVFT